MWGVELAIMAIMIVLNGLFAAYELALASIALPRLQALADQHRLGAKAALAMKQSIEGSLAVIQLGITLVGVIAAATGGAGAAEDVAPLLQANFGWTETVAEFFSLTLMVIPLTVATIVFGELIPKVFALRNREWVCLRMSPAMLWFAFAIWPVVWCLEGCVKGLLRVGERFWQRHLDEQTQEPGLELQELRASAALARTSRLIGSHAEQIIVEASSLSQHTVRDIMLPAEFISLLDLKSSIGEALVAAHLDMHTRFPVTAEQGNPQAICGYVTFKDIVTHMRTSPHDPSLQGIVRNIASFSDDLSVAQCLERLIREHLHIAIVRDHAGQVVGMVTQEDLMEELVGEIEDEYDRLPGHLVPIGQGWIVGGGLGLEAIRRQTGIVLIDDTTPKEVRTLNDWISHALKGPIRGGEIIHTSAARVIVRKSRRHNVMEAYLQPPG
jgi:putative hemolysin